MFDAPSQGLYALGLLVDFDIQGSLTISLGVNQKVKTFYELLHVPGTNLSDVIVKTNNTKLWIVTSGPKMDMLLNLK